MNRTVVLVARDALFALVPLVALGAWWWGAWAAFGVLASGVLAVGNVLLLGWLVGKMAAAIEAEAKDPTAPTGFSGAAVGVLMKTVLLLAVFGGLMAVFDPASVALGVGSVVIAVCIRGLLPSADRPTSGYGSNPAEGPVERG